MLKKERFWTECLEQWNTRASLHSNEGHDIGLFNLLQLVTSVCLDVAQSKYVSWPKTYIHVAEVSNLGRIKMLKTICSDKEYEQFL